MRMTESVILTLLRAILVTSLAWPLAWSMASFWRTETRFSVLVRPWIAVLAVIVWMVPPLLLTYAWNRTGLSIFEGELVYQGLLLMRMTPLALLLILCGPRQKSSSSGEWLGRELARQHRPLPLWPRFRGSWSRWKWALALVLLFTFQEFELSALLGVRTWTDDLFVDHAGGLPLNETLKLVIFPAMIALLLALAGQTQHSFFVTGHRLSHQSSTENRPSKLGRWSVVGGGLWLVLLGVMFSPLVGLIIQDAGGMGQYLWQGGRQRVILLNEVVTSLLLATTATMIALGLAEYTTRSLTHSAGQRQFEFAKWLGYGLLTLGLLGALTIGLMLRGLSVTLADLTGWRMSLPLWLLAGVVIKIFPLAWLVESMLQSRQPAAALSLADQVLRLHGQWRLRRVAHTEMGFDQTISQGFHTGSTFQKLANWRFQVALKPRLWLGVLIATFACADVLLTALLAPTGMATGTVRLYNFMHYGHSAALTAEALLLAIVPFALLSVLAMLISICMRSSGIRPRSYDSRHTIPGPPMVIARQTRNS